MRKTMVVLAVALVLQLSAAGIGFAAAPLDPLYHVVKRGETLSSIGYLYGVSPWAIARANSIPNPNLIYVGQVLLIPRGGYRPSYGGYIHVVMPGENLSMIAWRYGTTVWAIAQANNIPNPNFIYIGQRLVIPRIAPPPVPKPTPTPKITIGAIVKNVSPSARIIWLKEPVKGFSVVALTNETELISKDGRPITLLDIHPGSHIIAIGQPGSPGTLLAEKIIVQTKPTPTPHVAVCNPRVCITYPYVDSKLDEWGTTFVKGTAAIENLWYYKLEFGVGERPWDWSLIDGLHYWPVVNGILGEWNTGALPEGVYTLRLVAVDNTGNYPEPCEVRVIIER